MKILKRIFVLCFLVILILPVVFFNIKENVSSDIDNKVLMNFPFGENYEGTGDLTTDIDTYAQDRIGFRNQFIQANTVLNNVLFKEMVHPTYMYGKDDYVFFKAPRNITYGEYHDTFVDFTARASEYCEERDIPFLLAFNPAKITVMSDKLPDGYQLNNDWVDELLDTLEEKDVSYVDNTPLLKELTESGKMVFNKQYDAGHWNDWGAFYSVNNILQRMSQDNEKFQPNDLEDFDIKTTIQTSLPVSNFPIYEEIPAFELKKTIPDISEKYQSELRLASNYRTFGYYVHDENVKKNLPRVLVFQGSYMNGLGAKFLSNALGEYIHVHDYQNIIDLDYYINIFEPDYVVFEVAEYTLNNTYFDETRMREKYFNPPVSQLDSPVVTALTMDQIEIDKGNALTTLKVSNVPAAAEYVYLKIEDRIYDMEKIAEEEGYSLTIKNESFVSSEKIELIYQ